MTNYELYIKALDYIDIIDNEIYIKERAVYNNGGLDIRPRRKALVITEPCGYQHINLSINGKGKHLKTHVLLMLWYKGLPPDLSMQIDHIDGDKANNQLSNLEYVTHQQNCQRAFDTGLHVITEREREERRQRMIANNPMRNKETVHKVLTTKGKYHLTDAHRAKISQTLKGKPKTNRKYTIMAINNIVTLQFLSARHAEEYGFSRYQISKALRMNNLYKGYKWYVLS